MSATFDLNDLKQLKVRLKHADGQLGLPEALRLSEGEARGGGAQRASILADALEAVIGATFVDGGFEAARTLVRSLFGEVIATTEVGSWAKDAKTELQEYLQARRAPLPRYELAATSGAPGQQHFRVLCHVRGLAVPVEAQAGTKRAAEQRAARTALARLQGAEQ